MSIKAPLFAFVRGKSGTFTSEVYDNQKTEQMILQITGAFTSGSIKVQGHLDPDHLDEWFDLGVIPVALDSVITQIASPGLYTVSVDALSQIRVVGTSVNASVDVVGIATRGD